MVFFLSRPSHLHHNDIDEITLTTMVKLETNQEHLRYRNTFAEILVLGSILQKLDGEDLNQFERRRDNEQEDEHAEDAGITPDDDLEEVADKRFAGMTGKMLMRQVRKSSKAEFMV